MSRMTFALLAALLCLLATAARADELTRLRSDAWTLAIDPRTLRVVAQTAGGQSLVLSDAVPDLGDPAPAPDSPARWTYRNGELTADFRLDGDALIVSFRATKPGKMTWPVIPPGQNVRAWILPMFEGVYVPADDNTWAAFLAADPLNTTSDLSMPFFAIDTGTATVTYLATNAFNNQLAFSPLTPGKPAPLQAAFTHTFTPNRPLKEFGFRIVPGGPSPVEPARIYRRQLQADKQFVPLEQKIRQTPDAAKLAGAAHIYLWGNALISRHDITDPKKLATMILSGSKAGDRVLSFMDADTRALLRAIPAKEWVDNYDKSRLADALHAVLMRPDFYDAAAFADAIPAALRDQIAASRDNLPADQIRQRNIRVFAAAFAPTLAHEADWGDGWSPKMIHTLTEAGLDRLWLGSPDWDGLRLHPQSVRLAITRGYLVAPYDSFHSIHAPGTPDSWETAQFDQALFESGPVTDADGKKRAGFKKKGYILSSIAARPAVEARVTQLAREFACNSWFVDCDADGEVFDDYSPNHPATAQQDAAQRAGRMRWIAKTFVMVVGSERGSAYAADSIHFAHGMMTPSFGWGDPDLADPKSPFFLGKYYPPDGPACFFKTAELKPLHRHIYADPKFRIPLYQTAFHDSVITTHHWASGSLKFADPTHARELMELLYLVPPLYHLNRGSWDAQKPRILAHYAFFSPLHRTAATLPMTAFAWLTPDRLVQRTTFGNQLEMTANFSPTPVTIDGITIPPQSIVARHLQSNQTQTYSPAKK